MGPKPAVHYNYIAVGRLAVLSGLNSYKQDKRTEGVGAPSSESDSNRNPMKNHKKSKGDFWHGSKGRPPKKKSVFL